jgi:hypothetical protein
LPIVSPSVVATYGSSNPGRRRNEQHIYGVHSRISLATSDIPALRAAWQDRYKDIFGDIPLELPPFREVNHEINLIDPSGVIRYRVFRCPEALKDVIPFPDQDMIRNDVARYQVRS